MKLHTKKSLETLKQRAVEKNLLSYLYDQNTTPGFNTLRGRCPFCEQQIVSTCPFSMHHETQCYYCSRCGAHGDVLTFLMITRKISFNEAAKHAEAIIGEKILEEVQESEVEAEERRTRNLEAFLESTKGKAELKEIRDIVIEISNLAKEKKC